MRVEDYKMANYYFNLALFYEANDDLKKALEAIDHSISYSDEPFYQVTKARYQAALDNPEK